MTATFTIVHGLPFIGGVIHANSQKLFLEKVLLDTGSGGTVFKTVALEKIGVHLEPGDILQEIVATILNLISVYFCATLSLYLNVGVITS